jgi:hypothetical protein
MKFVTQNYKMPFKLETEAVSAVLNSHQNQNMECSDKGKKLGKRSRHHF